MTRIALPLLALVAASLSACGANPAADAAPSQPADPPPASPSAPPEPSAVQAEPAEVTADPGVPATDPAASGPLSRDILDRSQKTDRAELKHVLIAWSELAPAFRGEMDPRAARRSQADADRLAIDIRDRARNGEDFDKLMREYSEDPGSATTGRTYTATADAPLVPEFKQLGFRLDVGEVGVVKTMFGWHVIKRVS